METGLFEIYAEHFRDDRKTPKLLTAVTYWSIILGLTAVLVGVSVLSLRYIEHPWIAKPKSAPVRYDPAKPSTVRHQSRANTSNAQLPRIVH